jgi:hypothetical protein
VVLDAVDSPGAATGVGSAKGFCIGGGLIVRAGQGDAAAGRGGRV